MTDPCYIETYVAGRHGITLAIVMGDRHGVAFSWPEPTPWKRFDTAQASSVEGYH